MVIIENKAMKNGYIDALIQVNDEGMPLKKLVQFSVIELRENQNFKSRVFTMEKLH